VKGEDRLTAKEWTLRQSKERIMMIMEGEIKAMEREKMILFFLHNKESISREGLHYI